MTDDQQRARELKPCPFCGYAMAEEEDGAYQNDGFVGPQTPVWLVTCPGSDCNAGVSGTSKESAISAWNRRAALRAAPEVIRIPAADGLDPITVYADDLGEGRGRLTVCCYADSWSYTAAWGGMGGSLREFVNRINPQYLADNLLWPNVAKTSKHQRKYVERISASVIAAFAARPQGVKDGMITRVLMLANRWDEVAKTAPSQSGLMNEMARELRAVLHDDRDSVGADNA